MPRPSESVHRWRQPQSQTHTARAGGTGGCCDRERGTRERRLGQKPAAFRARPIDRALLESLDAIGGERAHPISPAIRSSTRLTRPSTEPLRFARGMARASQTPLRHRGGSEGEL